MVVVVVTFVFTLVSPVPTENIHPPENTPALPRAIHSPNICCILTNAWHLVQKIPALPVTAIQQKKLKISLCL